MKLNEITFEDKAFEACVLATGCENAEDIKELVCRKQKIASAAGIEYLSNLKYIDLTRNELSHLDLSKNVYLEEAFLGNNELTSLNISGCSALTYLEVFINQLEELDVSHNTELETLIASQNDLEKLDLCNNQKLIDLRLNKNELCDLEFSVLSRLERLELEKNPLNEATKNKLQNMRISQLQF